LSPLIGITILLAAALLGGIIAHRFKQPVILGYLVVGIIAGPQAFGLLNDPSLIKSAATIGVALLMFTLGLELSFDQLREVGRIGIWGGLAQVLLTTLVGFGVALVYLKWSLPQSILFGLVIYSASTAIGLKVLMDRGELSSVHGRIFMAIAIFQDIAAIVLVLILPVLSTTGGNILPDVLIAIGKVMAFIVVAIVFGVWVFPWLMGRIGGVGPRELFLLMVLVLAMGAAVGTSEFGLPSVFGAFIIGFILRQLKFTSQAIAEITPFRDVFAALFFISLGMLLDINYVIRNWQSIVILVLIIVAIKFLIVFGVTWFFGYGRRVSILTGAAMFHIGEFGFIIAQSGLDTKIISEQYYSLIIASAIITMLLMPSSMGLASWAFKKYGAPIGSGKKVQIPNTESVLTSVNSVLIAGYGRVGEHIAQGLLQAKIPFTVLELDPGRIVECRKCGLSHIYGDCSNSHILSQLGLSGVKTMVITYPDQLAVETTVRNVLRINPNINIIARVHRPKDAETLKRLGVHEIISPEYEASLEFLKRTLTIYGLCANDVEKTIVSVFKQEINAGLDQDKICKL
jgi:CPA2 family monovalent cation:H+ antiporter-2